MAILLSLAALSVAFAGGLGVVLLLRDGKLRLDPCGICGTALIGGAGLVALSYFWLGLLFQGAGLRLAVVAICLAPPLYVWQRNRWALPAFSLPSLNAPRAVIFAMAAVLFGCVTWFSLYRQSLMWDGLYNWEWKARAAFLNHGSIPLSYYSPGELFHKAYPPLVPVLEAWIYGFLGRHDQSMAKLIGPYFCLAALLLLISVSNRERKNGWSAVLVFLPFVLVPCLYLGDGSATSGYADFPLAAIYFCAVIHLTEHWQTGSSRSATLAGISAMLLVFTKSEGIIPLLCIAAAIAPMAVRERNWKLAARVALPGLGLWLIWKTFMKALHVPQEVDFIGFTPAIFLAHLDRARPLLAWTLQELTSWTRWSLVWPLTAAAFVLLIQRARGWQWYPWAAVVLLPLAIYPWTYFFSAWNPVELHVKSSLPRLFLHIAPVAALMVGLVFAEVWDTRVLWRRARAEDLPPEALDALLQQAAEILRPTGITVQHLRDEYQTNQLLEQAAEILRPAGLTMEHLQHALQKAAAEPRLQEAGAVIQKLPLKAKGQIR